jgi:drug/metabolite transporter (DMT)-like permease
MLNIKASPLRLVSSERTLFYGLSVAAIILLLVSWLAGETVPRVPEPRVLAAFAYTAVVIQFGSYLLLITVLKRHSAAFVGGFIFLSPVFGVLIASLVLGEPLSPMLGLAVALVSLGIYLVNRPSRPAAEAGLTAG